MFTRAKSRPLPRRFVSPLIHLTLIPAVLALLAGCSATPTVTGDGSGGEASQEQPMHEVVIELQDMIARNDWQSSFEEAIASAASYNIPTIDDVQTLDDYYGWINELLYWVPSENEAGREMYNRICEFYFFLDQEPVAGLQNEITPADQSPELTELSAWMVRYADAWGLWMDTTDSLTPASLQTFYDSPRFNMGDYMQAPGGWKTFNQFFARHTRPGVRPVAAPDDDRVIVSAADSTIVGSWPIDEQSRISVKGLEWSVLELLEGSPYADRFNGGVFMHAFLNTTDYHRLHVPVGGEVLESRVIPGQVYLDVQAVPVEGTDAHTIEAIRQFDAQDGTGYQFAQARGLIVIDSPIGLVAVLPIGMAQVSSVVMTAEEGVTLRKGEEFAYFQFGGSDHVVLFESGADVTITAEVGTHYNQGTRIGEARR